MSNLLELLTERKKDKKTKKRIIQKQIDNVDEKITQLQERKKQLKEDLKSLNTV